MCHKRAHSKFSTMHLTELVKRNRVTLKNSLANPVGKADVTLQTHYSSTNHQGGATVNPINFPDLLSHPTLFLWYWAEYTRKHCDQVYPTVQFCSIWWHHNIHTMSFDHKATLIAMPSVGSMTTLYASNKHHKKCLK